MSSIKEPNSSSESTALIPYIPPISSEEFIRNEVEKKTDAAFKEALELEKSARDYLTNDEDRYFAGLPYAQKSFMQMRSQNWRSSEVLVAKGDHILLHERSGDIPADTQYMIGSVSKQFFAVALLKAMYEQTEGNTEEDKTKIVEIKLQCPISDFLPENSPVWEWNKGQVPQWAKEISLHQLLSHTSGIPNYMNISLEMDDWNHTGKKFHELPHSASEVIELISGTEFLEKGKFNYSNTNYRIIAEVLGSISGMNPSEYIGKKLLAPLEMSSTFSATGGRSEELRLQPNYSKLAPELNFDRKEWKFSTSPLFYEDIGVAIGDGSIVSTARDLVKWNHALHDKQSILPKSLYQVFTTGYTTEPDGISQCYGIIKHQNGNLSHIGLISSYGTQLYYEPKHKLSVIVLSSVASTPNPEQEERYPDPHSQMMEILSRTLPCD